MGDSEGGTTVSATSLNAPKDAKKAYEKGHHAVEKNKASEAQQDLEKAVQIYPQYAAAWLDLGWLYTQQQNFDKARDAFTHAETADQHFVPAYVGLASIAVRESKWQEAANWSSRATEMDGVDFPAAFYYNSLANYRLGNLDQAEKSARKAEMLGAENSFPQVSLILGMILADRGDYADAAEQFRSYLKAAPNASNADAVRQQLANVQKEAEQSKAQAAPAK
jgi:tetratricopeptide (TPR) repeat protein